MNGPGKPHLEVVTNPTGPCVVLLPATPKRPCQNSRSGERSPLRFPRRFS